MSEIDTVSRKVAELTKDIGEVGREVDQTRHEFNKLFEGLVGEETSDEIKQKFQLVSIKLADKSQKMGELRKKLKEVSAHLLEIVKADGGEKFTTVDGVELTLTPTLQFKLPPPPKEEDAAGVEEEKAE